MGCMVNFLGLYVEISRLKGTRGTRSTCPDIPNKDIEVRLASTDSMFVFWVF